MGFAQNFPTSSYSSNYDLRGNAQDPLLTSDAGIQVGYTIGAESANTITVSCQLRDSVGTDIAYAAVVEQYLSSDSAGQTAVAAATSLASGTDGTILTEFTSNKHWSVVSEADGDIDIVVGDAVGAATYYLNTVLPGGMVVTSAVLTFAA